MAFTVYINGCFNGSEDRIATPVRSAMIPLQFYQAIPSFQCLMLDHLVLDQGS